MTSPHVIIVVVQVTLSDAPGARSVISEREHVWLSLNVSLKVTLTEVLPVFVTFIIHSICSPYVAWVTFAVLFTLIFAPPNTVKVTLPVTFTMFAFAGGSSIAHFVKALTKFV